MGQKLTDRTALTSIASGDLLHVVDVSDSTDSAGGTSKKITQDNLIPDASATVKGKVELATTAETETGTDATRAVTPDSYRDAFATTNAAITHSATEKTTAVDADELGLVDSAGSWVLKKITILGLKLAIYAGIKPAEGTMWNGKISVSDTGSGLTVALKTLSGNDPSASDPVYITLGGAVRTITAALSVTKADGTNWMNAGSSELATKEIDYFVYLGYNATDGVVIGFSRIPSANSYDDFSATSTNEKYCAISTITNAAATDYYEVVGRFAATLSAGAGYTWSVPTFTAKNLIQRPIFDTRWLAWVPVASYSGGGGSNLTPTVNRANYKIRMDSLLIDADISNNGSLSAGTGAYQLSFPFTVAYATLRHILQIQDASDASRYFPAWMGSNGKPNMDFAFDSQDAAGAPPAIAASDRIWISGAIFEL